MITDPEKFKDLAINDLQRTYWTEILQRSHWTAISTIQRNIKWMEGISLSLGSSNMFLFAAALRGFIEACADSLTTLALVLLTLAKHFRRIKLALTGQIRNNEVFIIPELEDELIHFAFAKASRKMKENKLKRVTLREQARSISKGLLKTSTMVRSIN